mgnify:CR=1 FL=1
MRRLRAVLSDWLRLLHFKTPPMPLGRRGERAAARYLRHQLGQYLQTAGKGTCLPCPRLTSAELLALRTGGIALMESTDAGFDARAQLRK